MKGSCLQENLSRGLGIVSRAVSTRSTLPVLGNVLIATDEGRLKLSATNLEIVITCWIGAKTETEGATTVPARSQNNTGRQSAVRTTQILSERADTMASASGASPGTCPGTSRSTN